MEDWEVLAFGDGAKCNGRTDPIGLLVEAGKGFEQLEAARQGIDGLGWLGHPPTVKEALEKVEGACPSPSKRDGDDHSARAGQVEAGGESGNGRCSCGGGYGSGDRDAVLVT